MAGWTIGTVTLPYGPERIDIGKPPKIEDFDLDGEDPIATVTVPATNDITLHGTISSNTASKSEVNTNYIADLLSQRGTSISVTDPADIYSGTYLLADAKITDESQGNYTRYKYTITLRTVTSVNVL